MSNNPSNKSSTTPKPTKVIEVGKFYLIHDGSPSGHPGLIIWKDDSKNLYLAIKFGSSPSKDNCKFSHPLSNDVPCNYFYKRLFLGKRKNFGGVVLIKLSIDDADLNTLIKSLDFLNPIYSSDIRRKDKRFFKWAIKNPLYQGQLSCPKGTT